MKLRFTKMHGAGNDFVVVDCRERPLGLNTDQIAAVVDEAAGVEGPRDLHARPHLVQ